MACTISIDGATLIATTNSTGDVVRIVVEGSAVGCDELSIRLEDNSEGILVSSVTVTPDAAGHWIATFIQGQNSDLKGILCGDKITIFAKCTKAHKDGDKCEADIEVPLPCKPGDGDCPRVSVALTAGACNAAGTARDMTFAVSVGGGAQIQYSWNFGDGSPLTPLTNGSGNFSVTRAYPVTDAPQTFFANLIIVVPPRCTATPDPISVLVNPCGATTCPDNPRIVADRHLPGNQRDRVDIEAPCVPAGDYTIGVSNVYPPGTTLFWSVDNVDAGASPSIEITIESGRTTQIEVIATKDSCRPVSEAIELSGCQECPTDNELVLERRLPNGRRETITLGEGCIPAGNYSVRLVEPSGDVAIDWFEDGVIVENQHGRSLRIRLDDGQTLTVSASVQIPGCASLNPALTIEACSCVADLALTLFDSNGDVMDPSQCVAPGTYTARADGSSLTDESSVRTWRINGREVAGNGSEHEVRVIAPVVASCSQSVAPTTVSLTVATPGCPAQTVSASLTPCAEFVFNTCCQSLGTVVLFVFGLTVIAAALALCPQALPLFAPFFLAFGLLIFLILLGVLIALVLLWLFICPPDWCRDILPKLWQGALMSGIIFIYFGSCPLCNVTPIGSLLLWGVGLLLLGAALLLWWILSCRPSTCQTLWRLIELGVVNTIIGGIVSVMTFIAATVAAACISPFAVAFLWLVIAFLDLLFFFLPQACGFNPIARSTFALFRRPFTNTNRIPARFSPAGSTLSATDLDRGGARASNVIAPQVAATAKARGCSCGGD